MHVVVILYNVVTVEKHTFKFLFISNSSVQKSQQPDLWNLTCDTELQVTCPCEIGTFSFCNVALNQAGSDLVEQSV